MRYMNRVGVNKYFSGWKKRKLILVFTYPKLLFIFHR